ncbi:MAG: ethylbenzene dehydrogenase-related protein, partial [Candidatus Hydrothermarchaeaceae archaeon]
MRMNLFVISVGLFILAAIAVPVNAAHMPEYAEDYDPTARTAVVPLQVKAAYSGTDMFFQFQWESDKGQYHDYYIYKEGQWVKGGGSWPLKSSDAALYEDRLSFNLDDGKVANFATQGCFVTCHDDMAEMPNHPSTDELKASAHFSTKSEMRKYILEPRTGAGYDSLKSAEEMDQIRAEGKFLDMWMWRASRSNPIGYVDDFWIFDYRNSDNGSGPFTTNFDTEKGQPTYMFDESKTGFKAYSSLEEWMAPDQENYYLSEDNSVPFDPTVQFAEGSVIPRRFLKTPTDSRGDITGSGVWSDGKWTMEMKRKLDTGHPLDDKVLEDGKTYDIAFQVHKDKSTGRWHYVSLVKTLGLGVDADIKAVKISGDSPDWSVITGTDVEQFLPGVASIEYLQSDAHPGKGGVIAGTACTTCHTVSDTVPLSVLAPMAEAKWLETVKPTPAPTTPAPTTP